MSSMSDEIEMAVRILMDDGVSEEYARLAAEATKAQEQQGWGPVQFAEKREDRGAA